MGTAAVMGATSPDRDLLRHRLGPWRRRRPPSAATETVIWAAAVMGATSPDHELLRHLLGHWR